MTVKNAHPTLLPPGHAEMIADIKKYGAGVAGRAELIKHLKGIRLSASERAKAQCYSCASWFSDGDPAGACNDTRCPLYPLFQKTHGGRKRKTPLFATPAKKEGGV